MITVKIRYTGDNGSARAFADKNSWTKYTCGDDCSTFQGALDVRWTSV